MAEKCKVCGGAVWLGICNQCPRCGGTGVEPVALVEREVLEVCQAMSQCPLNTRLAAVVEAGEGLAKIVADGLWVLESNGYTDQRKSSALAAWEKVRG